LQHLINHCVCRFLHKILQNTESYIGTLLHIATHDRLAALNDNDAHGKQRKSLITSSQPVENLVHHLTASVPGIVSRIMPKGAGKLGSAPEKDALLAMELLRLQISAPHCNGQMKSKSQQQLMLAQSNKSCRVRLKLANVLAACSSGTARVQDRGDVEKTLLVLALDSESAVRVAAVRGLGVSASYCGEHIAGSSSALGEQLELLSRMADRLRDSVPEVREAVRCCAALLCCKRCFAASVTVLDWGSIQ
jgi:hypothetical protein